MCITKGESLKWLLIHERLGSLTVIICTLKKTRITVHKAGCPFGARIPGELLVLSLCEKVSKDGGIIIIIIIIIKDNNKHRAANSR